jgi:hypothetical protein
MAMLQFYYSNLLMMQHLINLAILSSVCIFQNKDYLVMGHEFGAKKRKRNKRQQALTESQRGAMDKFIRKDTKVSSDNQSVDPSTLA